MPRTKGSKNKPKVESLSLDQQIAAAEAAIGELSAALKAKKAELKQLTKKRDAAEAQAAAQRVEENKAAILKAVADSGKSVDEILDLLKA